MRFIQEKYPQYTFFHEPLQERIVGVPRKYVAETRKPDEAFKQLIKKKPEDSLTEALQKILESTTSRSGLTVNDFGVFGSLLHGFYHPKFSDLDLIVYGRKKLRKLRETLQELYLEATSLRNEFENKKALAGKSWKFLNYSKKEYLRHQQRKMIYALFEDPQGGRVVKVEFEPVKDWKEIYNEYNLNTRITKKGWIKALTRVTNAQDAPFIPSIYQIETPEILEGPKVENVQRILSYVEEFRMQAEKDEKVYVEGNLEQVSDETRTFQQITLTYGPRYYEQVLKVLKP